MKTKRTRIAILSLLLVAMLLSLLPVAVFAEDGVITGSEVNIRTGPGLNYGVITSVKRNTVVTVSDRSDPDWYLISWNGNIGYVSSQFIRVEADADQTAVIQQAETPVIGSGTIVVPFGSGSTLVIVDATPSPTAAPSPSPATVSSPTPSPMTTRIPASPVTPSPTPTPSAPVSETVVVVGGLTLSPAATATALSPTPTAASVPAPSPTPVPASATASDAGVNAEIIANSVRLRNGPGTTYKIIRVLDKGTKLKVSNISGEWYAVTVDNVPGYVHIDYVAALAAAQADTGSAPSVTAEPAEQAQSSSTVSLSLGLSPAASPVTSVSVTDGYINAGSVRMREGPSMTAGIITELSYGSTLKITGITDGWYKVICGGHEGFVYSQYVTQGSFEPAAGITQAKGAELGKEIAAYALNFVGYPYTWGGKSPATGFDCSGFVQYVYSQFGYTTSRVANDVTSDGVHVDPSDIQPGDVLCFYSGNGYVGHVGIYIGDNSFVHAANSATGVVITSLSVGYYASRGYEIRRII